MRPKAVFIARKPRASPLYQCAVRHARELRATGRLRRAVEEKTIGRFLACGDPHHGFARIRCDACGHDYLLAYSCKTRYFCPSCHQRTSLSLFLIGSTCSPFRGSCARSSPGIGRG